jgi:hypothetical protein
MRQSKSTSSLLSEKFASSVKIVFDKVGMTPKSFVLEHQGVKMEGELRKKSAHQAEITARISGEIALDCDRCGNPYRHALDEKLTLRITDEVSQDKEDLDIIEFLDGVIDITYILESETNALIGDYHFCPSCATDDTPLEVEY